MKKLAFAWDFYTGLIEAFPAQTGFAIIVLAILALLF